MKLIFISFIIFSSSLHGQGYCSLRNPQAKIKTLYPHCNNFKTIIRSINEDTRKDLNKLLPFPLHYYEIGKHNLYIITDKNSINGLVHSRSEQSKWGLIEIVWSLNLDLTIKDYAFQRCRTSEKYALTKTEIKKLFIGKNFYQLLENTNLSEAPLKTKNGKILLQLLYKSALKTIALTDIAWNSKLETYRRPKGFINNTKNFQVKNYVLSHFQKADISYIEGHDVNTPSLKFYAQLKNKEFISFYSPLSTQLNLAEINTIKKILKSTPGQ